jgi:hypothetical protein
VVCSGGRIASPDNRGTRETGSRLSERVWAEAVVKFRAICVAALATGLLGGLFGCSPSLGPSDRVLDETAPTYLSPVSYTEPSDWAPIETPAVDDEPIYAAPKRAAPAYAAPAAAPRISPNRFSGGSTPPANNRAAARPGRPHPTGSRSRDWPDLEEWQIQAQWINPPPGAGE